MYCTLPPGSLNTPSDKSTTGRTRGDRKDSYTCSLRALASAKSVPQTECLAIVAATSSCKFTSSSNSSELESSLTPTKPTRISSCTLVLPGENSCDQRNCSTSLQSASVAQLTPYRAVPGSRPNLQSAVIAARHCLVGCILIIPGFTATR
ncbi:MAG: hypothetical protein MHM6MM_007369 [Cercozoa sp. M6MM]